MSYQKTNATGYIKDTQTGMVINTNNGEYEKIVAAREKESQRKSLEEDVRNMMVEMKELKSMFRELIGSMKN